MCDTRFKTGFIAILSFAVTMLVSCVPKMVSADTFEAEMRITNENFEVSNDGSLNFTVTSNHDELSIQSLKISDKDTYQLIYAGGSEYKIGTLTGAQETLDKGGYRYSFELRNVRFEVTHSGLLEIKLHDSVTGTDRELSARYYSLYAFGASLSYDKTSYVGAEPLVFKIHSNHDAFSIASAELLFTDSKGNVTSLEEPALKKGTMYSVQNGRMNRNGDVAFSLDCLKSLTEDGTVSLILSVYNEEEDETVVLSDVEPNTGKAVPYKFTYLKDFGASLKLLADPENAKPFEFIVTANRPFVLEEFTIKSNTGSLDFIETKPAQDGAVLNYGTQDSRKFSAGSETFIPDSKGELKVTVPAELVEIGEGKDHDGRVFMKMKNGETGQSVELTQGYHAKGFQPVYPTSVNVICNGQAFDPSAVHHLNEGEKITLELSLVPENTGWEHVDIALTGEGVTGEYAENENGSVRYYTLAGTDKPVESLFGIKIQKTGYTAEYKFSTRYRTALVIDISCREDFVITSEKAVYYTYPLLARWSGLPYRMEFSLCTWEGADRLSSAANSTVYPDLTDVHFSNMGNGDWGDVSVELSLESRPSSFTSNYFAYAGAAKRTWESGNTGWEKNRRQSASTPIAQTYVLKNAQRIYEEVGGGTMLKENNILSWLYFFDDYLTIPDLESMDSNTGQYTRMMSYHDTEWEDIRLVPKALDYNDSLLEVRYVIFRYQTKANGAFVNKMVPYWLTENYNNPAVISWKK